MEPLFRVGARSHAESTHTAGTPLDGAGACPDPRAGWNRAALLFLIAGITACAFVLASGRPSDAQDLPPGGTFLDEDLSTHEGYIEAIAAIGVTLGCEYEQFCPTAEVTREQMASFLARALDLPPSSTDHFTDDNASPHEANINRIADAEITLGCGGTSYCPYSAVTRAEMASFLARAFRLGGGATNHFTDDDGNPHEANIDKVADAGITLGCGGSSYCPDAPVLRDQMASFLGRGLGLSELRPPFPTRALVSRFYQWEPDRDDIHRYEVDDVHYHPRQFATGFYVGDDPDDIVTNANDYAGWDVLMPASEWSDRRDSQFFNFHLTRSTRVALVWRERWKATPSWLAGWQLAGTVSVDDDLLNVYEKTFGYGWHSLPGPTPDGEGAQVYTILLAESDGDPTAGPPVPAGQETPVPNELCPLWVHDSYTTIGWDGETYGTWHPQIDPVFWCYFGHEHGSDPRIIPGAPFVGYQYVADKVPQDEPDMGFKETIFRTTGGSYIRFIDHASTASVRRVCAQLHTVYVMAYDASGNEVFRTGFKADFGISEATDRDGSPLITPTNCGYDMGDLAESVPNGFEKRIRTTAGSNDYEQWRSGPTVQSSNLGMVFNHEFDIRDPFTFCTNLTCDTVTFHAPDRGQTGTRRQLDNTRGSDPFIFNHAIALATGVFYTDPYGLALVPAGAENATQQYIQPGFYMNLDSVLADAGHCAAIEPWTSEYACTDPSVGKIDISSSLDPAGWMAKLATGDS
jgi:hypothetical protein